MERRPAREWLREAVLTTGAVVGVTCVLAALGSIVFGLQPLIFRSGSMEPAIGTGALALAREVPATSVRSGDIVSVIAPSGTRITHRVVSTSPGPVTTLILKGDANDRPDTDAYPVSRVALVIGHVEYAGYVISWLRHPAAIFVGGVLVGILVMIAFTTRIPSSAGKPGGNDADDHEDWTSPPPAASRGRPPSDAVSGPDPHPRRARAPAERTHLPRAAPAAVVAITALLATVAGVHDTRAAFADTAPAASGAFSTRAGSWHRLSVAPHSECWASSSPGRRSPKRRATTSC